MAASGSKSVGETSTRFGFRDFRFENGYFRLNGRRVFWRSAHTGADGPGRIRLPHDPDLLRRDLLDLKAMGFNGVRFISTMPPRYQLEMCDEIGLMVYEESYASWQFQDSPKLAERMDRTLTGMVLRDRNHPSVVMWGLLNETGQGNVFRHAVASLRLVRRLDDSRIVMLGSGRFDASGQFYQRSGGVEARDRLRALHDAQSKAVWNLRGDALEAERGRHDPGRQWRACRGPLDRAGRRRLHNLGESFADRGRSPGLRFTSFSPESPRTGASSTYKRTRETIQDAQRPSGTATIRRGEHSDFLVGGRTPAGGDWCARWAANTTVAVTITSANGKKCDLAADFSRSKNPSGAWSYGWLAAGPSPDASTFKRYVKCETEKHDVIGGLSNPGSDHWEDVLADTHYYPRVPHRELEIARLRTFSGNDHHQFLSEYGIGSAVDLPRFLRQCEQDGMANTDTANEMRARLTTFMYAWDRLKLADTFATPENFFNQCLAKEAGLSGWESTPSVRIRTSSATA